MIRRVMIAAPLAASIAAAIDVRASSRAAALVLIAGSAYAMVVCVAAVRRQWPAGQPSPYLAAQRRVTSRATSAVPEIERLESALAFSASSMVEYHLRLRPLLAEVATARLAARDITADDLTGRPSAVLGDELWSLLQPPPRDRDRSERGPSIHQLERAVDRLEEV
jgi:hypothetical protein